VSRASLVRIQALALCPFLPALFLPLACPPQIAAQIVTRTTMEVIAAVVTRTGIAAVVTRTGIAVIAERAVSRDRKDLIAYDARGATSATTEGRCASHHLTHSMLL
jgi:hypothetical protein